MTATDTVFAGPIPAIYDRYMVPLLFRPYAEVVADRAKALSPSRILETAAGTGIVTEALHRALPEAEIVATDLNQPMLDEAQRRVPAANIQFVQADALDLPFEDSAGIWRWRHRARGACVPSLYAGAGFCMESERPHGVSRRRRHFL